MLAVLMAGVRLREKMVFLGEIMAANKGVVMQIPGSNSMAIHNLACEEMHCILGINTSMLDRMKSLSIGIARYTRNLDFLSDTEMVQKGKADIFISKDRMEEMEDDVNSDVDADGDEHLDVKSERLPSAQ